MDRLASVLEKWSRPNSIYWEVFKAPDFKVDGNVEDFILQFQKVAIVNDWSEMATLLLI